MVKMRIPGLALVAVCACTAVSAQERYVCKLGKSERTIEVVYTNPPDRVPCEVHYTRGNEARALWRSQHQDGYCEARAREFAGKHAGWGWSCTGGERKLVPPVEGARRETD